MKLGCVVMASGHAKRFGGNKLLYRIDGQTMLARTLAALPRERFESVVVARERAVAEEAARLGFPTLMNGDETDDPSVTIRLGLAALPRDIAGCLFLVGDQPYLTAASVHRVADAFEAKPDAIVSLAFAGKRGNPVLFPAALLPELAALPPFETGRYVLRRHGELLQLAEAGSAEELRDIDLPDEL